MNLPALHEYVITLRGCDDQTTVIVPLTPDQADGVATVADAANETSDHSCQPTMSIRHHHVRPDESDPNTDE